MHERGPIRINKNFLTKSGIAAAAASLAIATAEAQPSQLEHEKAPDHTPSPAMAIGKVSVASSSQYYNAKYGSYETASKKPVKYWYGLPSELKVIKSMNNAKYAKLAYKMAKDEPWFSKKQMYCIDRLWYRESKFDKYADNPKSTAYGIPQALPGSKMRSAGKNWRHRATVQIRWGYKKYIGPRYRNPCNAWRHSQAKDWY